MTKVSKAKDIKEAFFKKVFDEAYEKAMTAGREAIPAPIKVVESENPFDDTSPVKVDYGVYSEGLCGFAWVNMKPGNCRFANWLKKNGLARSDSYYGGVTIWVGEFNQSVTRKEAFARKMEEVFCENQDKLGFKSVYALSRLD